MTAFYDEQTERWECENCGHTWKKEDDELFCPKCGTWNGSNPEDA